MFTADQIVAHLIGDYVLQSQWMSDEKVKRWLPAVTHAFYYAVPFLFLLPSPPAWALIIASHFVIDRWRLARYVVAAKNFLCPPGTAHRWAYRYGTGYPPSVPPYLAVWLLIICDNVMHLICNALALRYL